MDHTHLHPFFSCRGGQESQDRFDGRGRGGGRGGGGGGLSGGGSAGGSARRGPDIVFERHVPKFLQASCAPLPPGIAAVLLAGERIADRWFLTPSVAQSHAHHLERHHEEMERKKEEAKKEFLEREGDDDEDEWDRKERVRGILRPAPRLPSLST